MESPHMMRQPLTVGQPLTERQSLRERQPHRKRQPHRERQPQMVSQSYMVRSLYMVRRWQWGEVSYSEARSYGKVVLYGESACYQVDVRLVSAVRNTLLICSPSRQWHKDSARCCERYMSLSWEVNLILFFRANFWLRACEGCLDDMFRLKGRFLGAYGSI